MAKLRTVKPVYEVNSGVEHPEHQVINTRVSHYLRLYATGKINEFPTNGLAENPELPQDLRNDLLNRNLPLPEIGTDPVEVMDYLAKNRSHYEDLIKDYNLCLSDKEKYDEAMSVINSKDASPEAIDQAVRVLEAIKEKARARVV
jgi:hypothetical protein